GFSCHAKTSHYRKRSRARQSPATVKIFLFFRSRFPFLSVCAGRRNQLSDSVVPPDNFAMAPAIRRNIMEKINWSRVILGGLLAGLIMNVGEFMLNVVVFAKELEEATRKLNLPPPGGDFIA